MSLECLQIFVTVLFVTVLFVTVLFMTVLYVTVLYVTVLYVTVLYVTVPKSGFMPRPMIFRFRRVPPLTEIGSCNVVRTDCNLLRWALRHRIGTATDRNGKRSRRFLLGCPSQGESSVRLL